MRTRAELANAVVEWIRALHPYAASFRIRRQVNEPEWVVRNLLQSLRKAGRIRWDKVSATWLVIDEPKVVANG